MSRVVIGVCGSIAAYKIAYLVRLSVKAGHEVKVIMTASAKQFVGDMTFAALTGHPAYDDVMQQASPMLHIELAKWAERILIAPATANTLSLLAQGGASTLLASVCLASTSPCYLAPAMNQAMWQHPATQQNIARLKRFGYRFLLPTIGEQACGDHGPGRLLEPEAIFKAIFADSHQLVGLKVLITAGPTYERLDPIRFLGNFSSGKMGYAMAEAFIAKGAEVTLISGPTALSPPEGCVVQTVQSAEQMLTAVQAHAGATDIFISVAAVANYSAKPQAHKIKSNQDELTLTLHKNADILQAVTQQYPKVFCVGFCAETDDIVVAAKAKRLRKGCQVMIANQVGAGGAPFAADDNAVFYINAEASRAIPMMPKSELAEQLLAYIMRDYQSAMTRPVKSTENPLP